MDNFPFYLTTMWYLHPAVAGYWGITGACSTNKGYSSWIDGWEAALMPSNLLYHQPASHTYVCALLHMSRPWLLKQSPVESELKRAQDWWFSHNHRAIEWEGEARWAQVHCVSPSESSAWMLTKAATLSSYYPWPINKHHVHNYVRAAGRGHCNMHSQK